MMSTEKKKVENEEVKEVEQNVQVENQQPAEQEQKPEKKKIDWKGIGKKVLIGAGAVAGAAVAFGAGYITGSHNSESGSDHADASDVGCSSEQPEEA